MDFTFENPEKLNPGTNLIVFHSSILHFAWRKLGPYRNMTVIFGNIDKSREAFAKPHGDLSVHVDSKGLKSLLQTTHGVIFEGAGILAQIHTSNLGKAQTTDWDKA